MLFLVFVLIGVIISALVFAWKSASRIRATERPSIRESGAKVYEIEGPLFFSSTDSFLEIYEIESIVKLKVGDKLGI